MTATATTHRYADGTMVLVTTAQAEEVAEVVGASNPAEGEQVTYTVRFLHDDTRSSWPASRVRRAVFADGPGDLACPACGGDYIATEDDGTASCDSCTLAGPLVTRAEAIALLSSTFPNAEWTHTGGGCMAFVLPWGDGPDSVFMATDGLWGEPSAPAPSGGVWHVGFYPDGDDAVAVDGVTPNGTGGWPAYVTATDDPAELLALLDRLTDAFDVER